MFLLRCLCGTLLLFCFVSAAKAQDWQFEMGRACYENYSGSPDCYRRYGLEPPSYRYRDGGRYDTPGYGYDRYQDYGRDYYSRGYGRSYESPYRNDRFHYFDQRGGERYYTYPEYRQRYSNERRRYRDYRHDDRRYGKHHREERRYKRRHHRY